MATVTHLNPQNLPRNPAFSQGVRVDGGASTIYVGGQNAVDAAGEIVGDDIATQTTQALRNLERVLAEGRAGLEHVVSWTISVVAGQDLRAAVGAFAAVWGSRGEPPAISVTIVAGLANPAFLVEISAIAVTG